MASRRERRAKKEGQKEEVQMRRERYRKRQKNKRIINIALATIVVLALAYGAFTLFSGGSSGEHDALARCLTEKGVIMYGTDWCPHCQAQKRMFADSFRYVTYVNCDFNKEACDLAGVEGYPTWVFPSGESLAGEQPLEVLAAQSSCA